VPSEQVIVELKQIISWRGKPQVIRCDNGPKYTSGRGLTTKTAHAWPRTDSLLSSSWSWLHKRSTSGPLAKGKYYLFRMDSAIFQSQSVSISKPSGILSVKSGSVAPVMKLPNSRKHDGRMRYSAPLIT